MGAGNKIINMGCTSYQQSQRADREMKSTIMLLGLVVLLTACADNQKTDAGLSRHCQAAYEAYLKQLEALPPETVKHATATTGVSVEEAKKLTRQMYADMSDEECTQSLQDALP